MMNPATKGVFKKPKIYGVSWTKVSSPTLTRTDDSKSFIANAGVGSNLVGNSFDNADIYKDIREVSDSYGNIFVRIPKFYIQKIDIAGFKSWRISKKKWDSTWYLPWCFSDGTNELQYVDVAKHPASLNGTKLESKPDVYPLINTTIVNFRTYATNNGTGYHQLDIHTVDMLQVLYLVEFATLNSQSIMAGWSAGNYTATHVATVAENAVNRIIVANAFAALYAVGQPIGIGTSLGGNQIFYGRDITSIDVYDASNKAISFDGAAVNIAIGNILYNVGWKNGFSSGITSKSGSLTSNSNAKSPMTYRGIENLWGNIIQWIDGVNINEYQAWVCLKHTDYASNLFASPYLQLGYINSNSNGYLKYVGFDNNYPFAEFGVTTDGSVTTYYCDSYGLSAGQRVWNIGGYFAFPTWAGLFCIYGSFASSSTSVYIGSRLIRKAM